MRTAAVMAVMVVIRDQVNIGAAAVAVLVVILVMAGQAVAVLGVHQQAGLRVSAAAVAVAVLAMGEVVVEALTVTAKVVVVRGASLTERKMELAVEAVLGQIPERLDRPT
jgi:hypothetical protein